MAVLVDRSVKRTLFSMAYPMLAGTFAMNAYNLTDTWFVSQLGTRTAPLAAMGFAFPVVMLLTFVAGGIGTGVTTLVSHAIGRHDRADAARLVTHGMALVLAVAAVMTTAGYLTVEQVFVRLGAKGKALSLVSEYMRIWYLGALFMSLPMLGNGILISAGDSKAASWFMILGTVVNTILDPIMIFGYLGFPAMGIRGAALATVIAQAISTGCLLVLLYRKHRLLTFDSWNTKAVLTSVRRILSFGIPSVLTMILMPISSTVITKILSGFGDAAVAASNAAGRIEMFAFMIPMTLGMSLTPFISQNFGAGRMDRVLEARRVSTRFALGYCGAVTVAFVAFAPYLARVFSEDPKVVDVATWYIWIVSFGYGMMEVHRYSGFFLTGLHRPKSTTMLNALRVLVLLIPLSWLGSHLWDVRGVFVGRLATDVIVGTVGILWVGRTLRSVAAEVRQQKQGQDGDESPSPAAR